MNENNDRVREILVEQLERLSKQAEEDDIGSLTYQLCELAKQITERDRLAMENHTAEWH